MASADASLCVLSLADADLKDADALVPDAVKQLISPSTYILLNKADLSNDGQVQRARQALGPCAGSWAVSLSTGSGLTTFVDELKNLLHRRCGVCQELLLILALSYPFSQVCRCRRARRTAGDERASSGAPASRDGVLGRCPGYRCAELYLHDVVIN